jgi:hypothetical protein
MNVQLIIAGALAIFGAAVHGVGGEILVIRRLSADVLTPSRLGGPRMTRTMIHVTWHLTTVGFLALGIALILSGSVLNGDQARVLGLAAAGMATGFAAVMFGLGAAGARSPRTFLRHPGPLVFAAAAALAWWGALSI